MADVEIPVKGTIQNAAFGSDIIAETLRAADLDFIALNPGASFRGLHDSIVNHLGNVGPKILTCLHEEHAVAIAHGYAKVTGRPMAVALHTNVGLMHATMAIYNAWCDRAPMMILGATGAIDAAQRRPWIEWIHTSRDQAALVRNYVKWDDQPGSVEAARESILRGAWMARTSPKAPVYIVLGTELQEDVSQDPYPIKPERYMQPARAAATEQGIAEALAALRSARNPLLLSGRSSRNTSEWRNRVELAERLGIRVVTDNRVGCSFPTDHPLHLGGVGTGLGEGTAIVNKAVAEADVILSLDWTDVAGALRLALGRKETTARIIHVTQDHILHNGWSFDHMAFPPVDLMLAGDPELVVAQLLGQLGDVPRRSPPTSAAQLKTPELNSGPITVSQLAFGLRTAVGDKDVSLLQLPLSWGDRDWHFRHPLDYIGTDGGGGMGSGPGISVGAALALKGTGRIPVGVFGDGNYLMGCTAIWTATHYRIPLLLVVANNQSFFNDEVHQERVARHRSRPVENKWIGQRMTDPEIDICAIAGGQGAVTIGPIDNASDLVEALKRAIAHVEDGKTVVMDVRTVAGYDT